MDSWKAPTAPTPVHATVTVPGSKSQTNRALVLAALATAQGTSTISGALRSRDTDLMIGAVRALGVTVEGDDYRAGGQRPNRAARRRQGRLRAGRHGAAVRSCCRGADAPRRWCSTATNRPEPAPSRHCSTRCGRSAWTSMATACRSRYAATDRCRAAPSRSTRRRRRSSSRGCCCPAHPSPTA